MATVPADAVEPLEVVPLEVVPLEVVPLEVVLTGVVAAVLGAVEVVFEATEAALAVSSMLAERSIIPAFGATSCATAPLLLPSDPPPHAASGRVTRAHRKRLRAAKVICVMNHYPGC